MRKTVSAVLFCLLWTWRLAATPAAAQEYLYEDARITGRQMHNFTVDGERVSVVLGEFVMTVGPRRFSGRSAVLWIHEVRQHGQARRNITLYIEGDARVSEPEGTVTQDQALLVSFRQAGELSASVGGHSERSMTDLPLYQRAAAARRAAAEAPAPATDEAPVRPEIPTQPAPETAVAVTRPAPEVPARVPPDVAWTLRADETRGMEGEVPGRYPILAKGNVYVGYGSPDSYEYMQMQADSAVVFTLPAEQAEPGALAGRLDLPGEGRLEGVYLEGDVRLWRGERTIRGSRLYYDFVNDRAIILDAVFRTVQEQRNIPVYVRAREIRQLSLREMWLRNAKVSTSEFYTPTYHIGATRAYIMDTTPRDEATGEPLDELSLDVRTVNTTFNIRGVPVGYWPYSRIAGEVPHWPLRRFQVGDHGDFGWGAESQWFLFRLLGLVPPQGFDARLDVDVYERATGVGINGEYARQTYTGYLRSYGVRDNEQEDDFGRQRKNILAPEYRGRLLWRHKQYLENNWQLQAELSYICDRNFLEEYFRSEFYNGKEQDTLLYAKKQQDNWAFTSLLQAQINHFQTGQIATPDLGFHLLGQPLADDRLTLFAEAHAGILRFQAGDDTRLESSDHLVRADLRTELDAPLHWNNLNVMPFALGRGTFWGDSPENGDLGRAYGGGGLRANLHLWRAYQDARSRLWALHGLRHVVTPELVAFAAASNVAPDKLYPFSPAIEEHLDGFQGVAIGLKQRLQTYRGAPAQRRSVDWMRLDVWAMFFNDTKDPHLTSDGRFFFDRPEYSLTRNAINADYSWQISDGTALLADANYDVNDSKLGIGNIGLAVERSPRLRYYLGLRYVEDFNSSVGTLGINYRINRKYELRFFQKYDFEFRDDGRNLATRISIIRKLPRSYVAITAAYDGSTSDCGVVLTFWLEGLSEISLGGWRLAPGQSSLMN